MRKFFITTPIYYSNGIPHIGHSYSSLLADVIARMKRVLGYSVKFSTGVDENSKKVIKKAQEKKMDIKEYLDYMAQQHKKIWDDLKISYTDFIRTTDNKHKKFVQNILQYTFDKQDIYKGKYEGLYCIGCEAFKKKDDLNEKGLCHDHLVKPEKISEENWFFKLSKYQNKLERFFKENPNFVFPSFRYNELKSFLKNKLEDFSVSRQTNKFGIKLPFDKSQVAYVWYDALLNYLTVCQGKDIDFWPADIHIIAKDILRFHAIYWPAMLMSAGYSISKKIVTTGFFTINGQKISKSLGNVIDPVELSKKYSRDALVLYLFYDIKIGNDGDFSWNRFNGIYNSMLVGGWGNLIFRVAKLASKYNIKQINVDINEFKNTKNIFLKGILDENILNIINNFFDNLDLQGYIRNWYDLVQYANKYIDQKQPWQVIKNNEKKGKQILINLVYLIEKLGLLSTPFFVRSREELQNMFKFNYIDTTKTLDKGLFNKLLINKQFTINLSPKIIYKKI